MCVSTIKEFTNLSALLRLEGWGVGRAEEGWVSLGLGNKQAGLDWPPALSLWIHWCDEMLGELSRGWPWARVLADMVSRVWGTAGGRGTGGTGCDRVASHRGGMYADLAEAPGTRLAPCSCSTNGLFGW